MPRRWLLCRRGYVTFGCFNMQAKINAGALDRWAWVLLAVPGARLLLTNWGYACPEICAKLRTEFVARGVDASRLQFASGANHRDFLDAYRDVDIALDVSPYSGGLTTCEAVIMGVPVVTLPGDRPTTRHSASHLHNAGLASLVASDEKDSLAIAGRLAADLDALTVLRDGLRAQLRASPLMDTRSFARHFMDILRHISA